MLYCRLILILFFISYSVVFITRNYLIILCNVLKKPIVFKDCAQIYRRITVDILINTNKIIKVAKRYVYIDREYATLYNEQ